jgi:hypothetical protein
MKSKGNAPRAAWLRQARAISGTMLSNHRADIDA